MCMERSVRQWPPILMYPPDEATMPRRKPAADPSTHLRRTIAAKAARLMAEDGIADFGLAKRKAARQLGAGQSEALPTNEEIESELRSFLAIYQEDEQPERLRALRTVALEVMGLFADFNPHLTGAVLEGTAGRYAQVEIELFADSSKDVEIFLLSHGIDYTLADNRNDNRNQGNDSRLVLDWDGIPVEISIFPAMAQRQNRKNRTRARAAAVADLLKESP
jgi:hypothetical protein